MKREIVVIGGGASGMMAAITAAERGAKVTILEQNDRNGKKLGATGNGKCNFTNGYWDEQVLRGTHPAFADAALKQFSVEKTLEFFRSVGICPMEKNGYYYPRCGQASAVTELLNLKARSLGVKQKTLEKVVSISENGSDALHAWTVFTEGWKYEADAVILACGSCASNIAGSDGSGYTLAGDLGHTIIKPLPALTGLRLSAKEKILKKWAGVRTEGTIKIYIDEILAAASYGELQLTEYGISGIPVFQVSRYAVRALDEQKKVRTELDFLPMFTEAELEEMLAYRREHCSYLKHEQLLLGVLPDKLLAALSLAEDFRGSLKKWSFNVREGMSFAQAQVASGGVSTEEIHCETMESRIRPGIFFAGELMDIDGTCGGYNLQWAWSSGYTAGYHAAGEESE